MELALVMLVVVFGVAIIVYAGVRNPAQSPAEADIASGRPDDPGSQ
jgi:hypothetical protein